MNLRNIIKTIPKWIRMLAGNDALHVEQNEGKVYEIGLLNGYYNDLTLKVSDKTILDKNGIPLNVLATSETVYSPVSIIQYGLGLFDLFLISKNEEYLNRALKIADWLKEAQDKNGGWSVDLKNPKRQYYSAMSQGEAISLLTRVSKNVTTTKYDVVIKKAFALLIKDIKDGGCTAYNGEKITLLEYTDMPEILNGSIFALWGIIDYSIYFDDFQVQLLAEKIAGDLSQNLNHFDNGYWSMYTDGDMIASPFYHNLHVAQLSVLEKQFPDMKFGEYKKVFEKYKKSKLKKYRAFLVKAVQKLKSKQEIVVVR